MKNSALNCRSLNAKGVSVLSENISSRFTRTLCSTADAEMLRVRQLSEGSRDEDDRPPPAHLSLHQRQGFFKIKKRTNKPKFLSFPTMNRQINKEFEKLAGEKSASRMIQLRLKIRQKCKR